MDFLLSMCSFDGQIKTVISHWREVVHANLDPLLEEVRAELTQNKNLDVRARIQEKEVAPQSFIGEVNKRIHEETRLWASDWSFNSAYRAKLILKHLTCAAYYLEIKEEFLTQLHRVTR